MAGLYCGWRLLKSGYPAHSLRIFDALDRHGGRVHTVSWDGDPAMRLDLGAHVISDGHRIAHGLVSHFGLATAPVGTSQDTAILHLRGRTRGEREVRRSYFRKAFAYDAGWRWLRRSPRRMLKDALQAHELPGSGRGGVPAYSKELSGQALDAVLRQRLTAEELRYLSDRLGYSVGEASVNAGTTLDWLWTEMFGGRYVTIAGGMSELTAALAASMSEHGVTIGTGHRLDRFEAGRDGAPSTLHFRVDGVDRRSVETERTILAMPPGGLKPVEGVADLPAVKELFGAITPWPLVTGGIIFDEPWWQAGKLAGDRAISDLPIGQLFLASTDARAGRSTGVGVAKAYAEGQRTAYWRAFSRDAAPGKWRGPGDPLAAEVSRQMGQVLGRGVSGSVPEPLDVCLQDWQEFPFGAGFHLWSSGSHPDKAFNTALKPMPDCELHICGEAWSRRQAWMEGALESSEALLERHFGLLRCK
ncbi:MAG: FAD-dependent oxidoreductase [Alphaproteobacteria bacterium]|nr:FAD-dependent oxidoreductase [Alphaproteobacteria bacterium]